MRFVQLIFVVVVLVVAVDAMMEDLRDEPVCTCAVFGHMGEDKITGVPLLTKALRFEADCDENGVTDCANLCKTLGETGAANESQDLCQAIGNTENPLRPSFYSKICYEEVWTYTGLSSSRGYCCAEREHEVSQVATE